MKIEGNEPLYPIKGSAAEHQYSGITIRAYFAAMALQGLASTPSDNLGSEDKVFMSVQYADALINELNSSKDKES